MSAAQLETSDHDEALAHMVSSPLKQQVAERLAAHRARRTRIGREQTSHQPTLLEAPAPAPARVNKIAAAVAERYAQSQSYNAFLQAEAEKALQQAQAAAEVAARNARAIAEAQREMLAEMAHKAEIEAAERAVFAPVLVEPIALAPVVVAPVVVAPVAFTQVAEIYVEPIAEPLAVEPQARWFKEEMPPAAAPVAPPVAKQKVTVKQTSSSGFSVRLYEDVGRPHKDVSRREGSLDFEAEVRLDDEERRALDEEIEFRQAPTFELERPTTPIPGNLLEFPRQLVATRKARPRYAEGPLREDGAMAHDGAQLRIFEVEATQISAAPAGESVAPEWSSIWLDALKPEVQEEVVEEKEYSVVLPPQTAPVSRRVMAGLVDGCLVTGATVAFGTGFAYYAPALPSLPVMGIAAGGVLAAFFLIYQMLFFTFSDSTPGMRYARIGLCTFSDDNPTRAAMRRRTFAMLLALLPLGFGFLWACLDDDRLGWHDRISRMYQRSY
ncbi:RDD family protein [Granulicella sibirica]|nr:RDD family protein [Granulicella sibirica]